MRFRCPHCYAQIHAMRFSRTVTEMGICYLSRNGLSPARPVDFETEDTDDPRDEAFDCIECGATIDNPEESVLRFDDNWTPTNTLAQEWVQAQAALSPTERSDAYQRMRREINRQRRIREQAAQMAARAQEQAEAGVAAQIGDGTYRIFEPVYERIHNRMEVGTIEGEDSDETNLPAVNRTTQLFEQRRVGQFDRHTQGLRKCGSCGRLHDLDEVLPKGISQVECVCGSRVTLDSPSVTEV